MSVECFVDNGLSNCHEIMELEIDIHFQINQTDAVLGINLGKNKTSQDAVDDYVQGVKMLGKKSTENY